MTPKETSQSYDSLASHWNGPSFNRENGIEQHRRALQFVSKKGTAIDIGCGSSGRFIDLLVEEGFEVEGLDISPEMLRLARKRHPESSFFEADICEWGFSKKYDFISAWDSVWHVPLSQQEPVLRKLCAGLSNAGVLIFTSGGVDAPEDVTNPCLGQPLYHSALAISENLAIIADCGCVCRHLEYDQYPERHIYFIVQRAELPISS